MCSLREQIIALCFAQFAPPLLISSCWNKQLSSFLKQTILFFSKLPALSAKIKRPQFKHQKETASSIIIILSELPIIRWFANCNYYCSWMQLSAVGKCKALLGWQCERGIFVVRFSGADRLGWRPPFASGALI